MAVAESERGIGIGRALVARSLAIAEDEGCVQVDRARRVTLETGYVDPILIDGIELRDRVWFSDEFSEFSRGQ